MVKAASGPSLICHLQSGLTALCWQGSLKFKYSVHDKYSVQYKYRVQYK